jgi:hypothetical protein
MPPCDVVTLIGFPTKKNNPPIAHAGKVNQAMTIVFQLNAQRFQFTSAQREINEKFCVPLAVRGATTAVFGPFGGVLRGTLKCNETPMCALYLLHNWPHVRQEGISFFDGE